MAKHSCIARTIIFIYFISIYLCIVMSCTYCVVLCFCFVFHRLVHPMLPVFHRLMHPMLPVFHRLVHSMLPVVLRPVHPMLPVSSCDCPFGFAGRY